MFKVIKCGLRLFCPSELVCLPEKPIESESFFA
jgi:hypothetical protein